MVCKGHVRELRMTHNEAKKVMAKRGFSTVAIIQPYHRQKKPFMEHNTTPRALNHRLTELPKNVVQNDRHPITNAE
ncbi:hypothetical protein L484_017064 [Morus notabilis]|uniref:Uncharacterized protein n=1 Tax=Morus notabilis TaxID=981085 RepID=W9S1H1_9ROSA|nr:hypothetical protein L484_017064 [Morus notabilis]